MIGRLLTYVYVVHLFASADDVASDGSPVNDQDAEEHPTTNVMKQVTIANSAEVLDERHIAVRDPKLKTKRTLRLGNVAMIEDQDAEKKEAKVEAAKEVLSKLVGQAVFLWKAAADEHQPKGEGDDFLLADVWTADGRHVPSLMANEGHLTAELTYESEWTQDILQAATGKEKKAAYAKLDAAIRESQATKAAEAEKVQKVEEPPEPIGLGGWIGLLVLGAIVIGVFTNFGQGAKKKNPNRKKSSMEKVWSKIKGQ